MTHSPTPPSATLADGASAPPASLWRLIRSAQPSLGLLALACVATLVAVAGTLYFPVLTRQFVDELGSAGLRARAVAELAGVLLGSTAAGALAGWLVARVGHAMVATLRLGLIDKLLRLPVAAFDRESSGEQVSRVVSDCESISELVTRQMINMLSGVLLLVGSMVVLLLLDVQLTLTLLGCVAGAFAVVIPVAFLLDGLSRRIQNETARLGGLLTQVLSEIRLVKAYTAERRERERGRTHVEGIRRLGLRVAGINVALEPLMGLATSVAIVVILVVGTARVSRGEISIGTLTAFILYIFNIANPLVQLTQFTAGWQKAKGASSRIGAIMAEADEETRAGTAEVPALAALEFRDVTFGYPGRDAPVLHAVDLHFPPGTTTALVGASGNGKTTVLSLIERFYAPTEGDILYGGTSISGFPLAAWRSRIGYVAQTAPIMPGTVRDNITYGLSGVYSDDRVRAAAEQAGALSFIERMPEGLDTVLLEQGNNLSGGQRQRIAIARMFLRNPEILILDEATSALDSETEHQVRIALESLMQGRTNIVVAHRLSTVMHADRIYFLEDGRISGMGRHEELVAMHPPYARLVARQFRQGPELAALDGIATEAPIRTLRQVNS
uniref:ABC transporter n=1 Tax=Eleftheria terrae TaxID=1597781 RepID=A0A0B5H2X6_9BURK|nr:ABC transporter [Eleftheria terrae]